MGGKIPNISCRHVRDGPKYEVQSNEIIEISNLIPFREMRESAFRAKVYRASSHRDVRYDGPLRSVEKNGGDSSDKVASTVTCGGLCADGWGKYREGSTTLRVIG